MWWYKPVNPALGRLRQEYCEFEVGLGYITSLRLTQEKIKEGKEGEREKERKQQKSNEKKRFQSPRSSRKLVEYEKPPRDANRGGHFLQTQPERFRPAHHPSLWPPS